MTGIPTVSDLVAALERRFPAAWAEPWDRVGLLVGDADVPLERVYVTLDATRQALAAAAEAGANVLLTHHPAFLTAPETVTPGSPGGAIALAAASAGVALACAHTNLDRAPEGASALARALGLDPVSPLEGSRNPSSLVTLYAPEAAADAIVAAMTTAGAGRIGEYVGCAYLARGEGRFTPIGAASPTLGAPASESRVAEVMLQMTCPTSQVDSVIRAAATEHPYEEPAIFVSNGDLRRGAAALGRICRVPEGTTLGDLARRAADELGCSPRCWGRVDEPVETAACVSGSAGSLVGSALSAKASVLVAGEVRYHDATMALEAGMSVIELGHDASEWPLVSVLAEVARSVVPKSSDVVQALFSRRWWSLGEKS